ncbi:UPF0481 protein At3g47200-like [Bidens hawaiensis]|uniref:UPF0481 protein At3g47200-like n=1 Tax=Bidens hawaiensis TaxID=980011 RepID=UPI004049B9DB
MENVDVELGDVNIVPETVHSLLNYVREKHNVNKYSPSIYMAPSNLRNLSQCSFKPRVVSIGPLHKKDETLQRFEVQKAAFVHELLSRNEPSLTQVQTLTSCVEKVASMIEKIKGSYADAKSYNDSELVKMMVTDACFILEFIHDMTPGSKLRLQDQYIPYDLVLLENQILFYVLNAIYECCINKFEEPLPLTEFLLPLLKYVNLFEGRIKVGGGSRSYNNHDHILGYLQHCYQPKYDIPSGFPRSTIHSAVELDRAGVNFKPKQDAKWAMAIKIKPSKYCSSTFWFKPTLTMPTLRINDFTELVLRNLIAYEQSYVVTPYVTSYARAMDMLIDTHEDIARLVKSKVVINHIGSNEEAAKMINRKCKEVVPEHFFYTKQWEGLDKHFNGYWPRKMMKLKRIYKV